MINVADFTAYRSMTTSRPRMSRKNKAIEKKSERGNVLYVTHSPRGSSLMQTSAAEFSAVSRAII